MEDLGKNIICTSMSIRRFMDQIADSYNLKGSQARIIKYIAKNNNVTASNIENAFNMKKSTVSDHLNSLENLGYIVRIVDQNDSRKKIVQLTSKGEELDRNIKNKFMQNERYLSSLFTKEELDVLNDALIKVKKKLKEEKNV